METERLMSLTEYRWARYHGQRKVTSELLSARWQPAAQLQFAHMYWESTYHSAASRGVVLSHPEALAMQTGQDGGAGTQWGAVGSGG